MTASGFKEVAHTADLAIKVWAEDFSSLLTESARGMYALMEITEIRSHHEVTTFLILDGSRETILVDFLNELLFLVEEKMEKYEQFSITRVDKGLEVTAQGVSIKSIQREIKAVTFHNLAITDADESVITEITFDI